VVIIWFFFWWKVVKSRPEEDPYISPEELKYIQHSLGNAPCKVQTSRSGSALKITALFGN
jgi:uncharacterized protein YneF (UPF0154 family)